MAVIDRIPYEPRSTQNYRRNYGRDTVRGSKRDFKYGTPALANPRNCFRCGQAGHQHFECRHLRENCRFCQIRGHSSDVCRSKARAEKANEDERYTKKERLELQAINEAITPKSDDMEKVTNGV